MISIALTSTPTTDAIAAANIDDALFASLTEMPVNVTTAMNRGAAVEDAVGFGVVEGVRVGSPVGPDVGFFVVGVGVGWYDGRDVVGPPVGDDVVGS